jgi:hypothetical protein
MSARNASLPFKRWPSGGPVAAEILSPLRVEDQWMTAYVLVIFLTASGHHQPYAVGYPDQGSCLVAAERLRRNKKFHVECLKFVQGR